MASTIAPGRPTSFGVAFAVLPPPQREAIRAVHAWSRSVDDSVDEESDPARARSELLRWRREVAACYEGEPEEPASRALRPHLRRYGIPRHHLDNLVSGVEMDLTLSRYPSFSELRSYCYRVASVVGLICLHIFGEEEERGRAYAENLGLALQLTNILRDLGRDHARGRIYLPADEREAHGYSEEALARHERSEPFRSLMRFQAARVRDLFAAAEREARRLDPRRIVAAEIMGRVYRRLMDRIEASGFDVFSREIRVPRAERLWIAGRALIAARTAR
ncbi:MAG TPA: presqualene diphosphate synthase HpnD [Candidatus Eisenbacteria bacterium]|jgi:phytoene synthase